MSLSQPRDWPQPSYQTYLFNELAKQQAQVTNCGGKVYRESENSVMFYVSHELEHDRLKYELLEPFT